MGDDTVFSHTFDNRAFVFSNSLTFLSCFESDVITSSSLASFALDVLEWIEYSSIAIDSFELAQGTED